MIHHRQKVLLAMLEAFGGKLRPTDFQKYLFLYTQKCEREKSYEFVPYKFGCFSFQAAVDKRKLIEKGYLKDSEDWELAKPDLSYSHVLTKDQQAKIALFSSRHKNIKGKELVRYVYVNYPYFATNSEIARETLTDEAYLKVQQAKPKKRRKNVMATIGYEGSSVENYLNRLIVNDIRVLVDVRKNPISRKYGFSKKSLSTLLSRVNIDYVHYPELGIDAAERKNLSTQFDYDRLFQSYKSTVLKEQKNALQTLVDLHDEKKRIALTCFEKDHHQCHRGCLADKLLSIDQSIDVQHL